MSHQPTQASLFGGESSRPAPEGAIWGFGEHGFLSNFYPSPVVFEGMEFPTVEHAFQAAKTLDRNERARIATLPTPGRAKRAGRKLALRQDWEGVKVAVMRQLLVEKFRPGSRLAAELVATHPAPIFEANHWNDRFWGVDEVTGAGRNQLGLLLEEIRARLLAES